jgi:hypothetical protein
MEGQKWPNKSLRKAAGIEHSVALEVRKSRKPNGGRMPLASSDDLPIEGRHTVVDDGAGQAPVRKAVGKNALEAQVREILNAVPGPYANKSKHVEAILAANDIRPEEQKWTDKSIQKAVGFKKPWDVQVIRRQRAPDTPRTVEIRQFLADSAPEEGSESTYSRYRRALRENVMRPEGQKWPDKGMQKAAGISPAHAATVRYLTAPDSPCTSEIRGYLDATSPGIESASDRFRRALDANDERKQWPEKSMQKAAGVDPTQARRVRERWRAARETGNPPEPDAE